MRDRRTWLLTALVALALAAPASAQTGTAGTPGSTTAGAATTGVPTLTTQTDPNALVRPESLTERPEGRLLTGKEAREIAEAVPKVVAERERFPGSTVDVFLKGRTRWQVSFYATVDGRRKEIAQVLIQDATGEVSEAWTGPQVAWTMARGYPGAFGRKAAAAYVWIPLLVLFVLPFVDWRRPLRMRHLDLLMLCSLSVSLAFFSHGNLAGSVPTTYPPLLYLLGRLLWIGYRRGAPAPARHLLGGARAPYWLAIATIFLVGFRIGLNVLDSNVIDVGYSGVIGADKLTHGDALYGDFPRDNEHGDTYGPVNYLVYVPFELIWPWSGGWDDLPAAHGAAVVFDLLCLLGLFLLGRRVRDTTLGIVLAYAWAAFPFTLFSLCTNSNDALVAAFLIWALYVAAHPARRGVLAALAGLTKFAPLSLVPLLALHGTQGRSLRERVRAVARFALGFAITAAIAMLPVWLQGDLGLVWDRTLGFQLDRDAPFSVWGRYDGLDGVQVAVQAAAVVFAVAAAFLPRRRDVIGLAAVAGSILLLLQLGTTYWFYLYIVWVLPFAFVALLGRDGETPPAPEPRAQALPGDEELLDRVGAQRA